ncbi:glycine--tRNA ligase subunit beta [uncultured Thiodictyon sp.]|uniref:glycine--tRNA ligase subunit beta n=1 Tax=uncultured Thiodictyon sp. TaxID=1846217 RepID=UPI0025FA123F|nr:glycine--tRNA ligase subunit beta [uncultured Thiodictyon sp.]
MTKDLLIEIGTEELPPLSLQDLAVAFARGVAEQLTAQGIGHGSYSTFCTPRRLAILVSGVKVRQAERVISRRGPSVSAAFDAAGQPTKAVVGFARSCGVAVESLEREESEKGTWIVFRTVEAGALTARLIPQIVELALAGLPIAKRMRWGAGDAEFVRPVHWVCLVFGDEAIPGTIMGITAGRDTFGHRFHAPGPRAVTHASRYPELLRDGGFVEPSFEQRRALITTQVAQIAEENGVVVDLPSDLLDEVTALVEWPVAFVGSFDEAFLSVPADVLIETMQKNQKYFPVRGVDGRLRASFVAICNIESKSPAEVRKGNERVLRPRFADAKFFWEQDRRRPLAGYFSELESVVFQDKLGSVADRSRRVAKLGTMIATSSAVDPLLVERAAMLAKCDLVTSLVIEFPSLQGVMGGYYAEHGGEPAVVCSAIAQQYYPRSAGGELPGTPIGLVLALADRLDLLVGVFGIGHRPTGAKDPYGLRRASIAIIRILVETPLDLDLHVLLAGAVAHFPPARLSQDTADAVFVYVLARLKGYYQEQGVSLDCVEAVIAAGGAVISQLDRRIRAVQAFRNLPASESLAAANKRISNILAKTDISFAPDTSPDPLLFTESAERQLWQSVCQLERRIAPLIRSEDFSGVLVRLAELREDVDAFFEQVMVMCEDAAVRENRLVLLMRLQALFLNVADVSLLR